MGDRRGLRRLRVRVEGEDRVALTHGHAEQRRPQVQARLDEPQQVLPLPHPVQRHVDVVAAARGVQATRDVGAAGAFDEPVDVEEEILEGAVENGAPDLRLVQRVERVAQSPRVPGRHDPPLREHDQVRVVDGDQRGEEEPLRVLEVLVEDRRDVLGGEAHASV